MTVSIPKEIALQRRKKTKSLPFALFLLTSVLSAGSCGPTWRGLEVQEENRCSDYDREKDYQHKQSVEKEIIKRMGGIIYGPYTGRRFSSPTQTDIEHIVGASEAHDSGLCKADHETRMRFSMDLDNLTLAAPEVNRCQGFRSKCDKDAGQWMPDRNPCWFSKKVIEVKKKYGLSVDRREKEMLQYMLDNCENFEMTVYPPEKSLPEIDHPLAHWEYKDVLDQIRKAILPERLEIRGTYVRCEYIKKAGLAPAYRGDPAYGIARDQDGDGIVCE